MLNLGLLMFLFLALLSTASGQRVEKTIYLPDSLCGVSYPSCIAHNSVDNKIYVSGEYGRQGGRGGYDCWVVVIDGLTNQRSARISVRGEVTAMCYNSVSNSVYCAHWDSVSVIDGSGDSLIARVAVGARPSALCYNSLNNKMYCCNRSSHTVSVIDGVTNRVLATIPEVDAPMSYVPASNRLYAARADSLLVVDGAADTVLRSLYLGGRAAALCYNTAENKVYCSWGMNYVSVFNGATDSLLAKLQVRAADLYYDPIVNATYCAGAADSAVWVIDGVADSVIATIPAPNRFYPNRLCGNPEVNRVYCVDEYGPKMLVIDAMLNRVVKEVPVGEQPVALCYNPADSKVYCVNQDNDNITVVSGPGDSVEATVSVGCRPWALCYSPVSNKVYCASSSNPIVSVVDGAANGILAELRVGRRPSAMCYNSSKNRVYTANWDSGDVTVIDCGLDSVIATVPVGEGPSALCYSAASNKVYCANHSGGVTVIHGVTNEVLARVDRNNSYNDLCYNSVGNKVYCAKTHGGASVLDCSNDSIVAVVDSPVGYPGRLLYNRISNKVYAYFEKLWVIDGTADTVITVDRRAAAWWASCHNSTDNKAYFSSVWQGDYFVLVVDGVADTAVTVIRPNRDVHDMCYVSMTNKVYCASAAYNEVLVIDGATDRIVRSFDVGLLPRALASNPTQKQVYVANHLSGSISVIQDSAVGGTVEESVAFLTERRPLAATVVRGSLFLTDKAPTALLDVTGRRVALLGPGLNRLHGVPPGVYFLTTEGDIDRKLILTR